MVFFRGCHTSGDDTVFIIWTRIASKMAPHIVCKGRETFSSSGVMSGYFAFLIGWSILYGGSVMVPSFIWMVRGVSNMNFSHAVHHKLRLLKSPSYLR